MPTTQQLSLRAPTHIAASGIESCTSETFGGAFTSSLAAPAVLTFLPLLFCCPAGLQHGSVQSLLALEERHAGNKHAPRGWSYAAPEGSLHRGGLAAAAFGRMAVLPGGPFSSGIGQELPLSVDLMGDSDVTVFKSMVGDSEASERNVRARPVPALPSRPVLLFGTTPPGITSLCTLRATSADLS